MFQLKTKTVEIDGDVFTVNEPMAQDVIAMNQVADDQSKPLFLIGRCVSFNGEVLGENAGRVPSRYLNKLSEVVGELAGWGEGNG